jgi:acyl-CoA thioester hydrolase
MQNALKDRTEIRVRFNEADPLGIVWHGHYIRYLEDGREGFGNKFGITYLDFYNQGLIVPVVNVQCDFKLPLRYGDRVLIETTYIPCLAAKLKFDYQLFNSQTGQQVATGSSIQVFLDRYSSVLQLTNPPFLEDWKRKQGLV